MVPRDPEWPQPSSLAPRAAAGACSGSPGAALRFPEFPSQKGLDQAPGQPPARGPAPRKQRNQNRLELPGFCSGIEQTLKERPVPLPPPALLLLFPQSDSKDPRPPPVSCSKSSKLLFPLKKKSHECNSTPTSIPNDQKHPGPGLLLGALSSISLPIRDLNFLTKQTGGEFFFLLMVWEGW